jgi:di/tripeptidase
MYSGHMDTVTEIVENRKIIEEGSILKSSEGFLGADDHAGVAAILEILSRVQETFICPRFPIFSANVPVCPTRRKNGCP